MTLFYNIFLFFGMQIIYVIKTKYEIIKIYSIKAKYKLLFAGTLYFLLYVEILYFVTYFLLFELYLFML